jgi:hypothetical protein
LFFKFKFSASSDALQKARKVVFLEEDSIRKEYMTKLYEIINQEAGKPETLSQGFGEFTTLLDEKERYFKKMKLIIQTENPVSP